MYAVVALPSMKTGALAFKTEFDGAAEARKKLSQLGS